MNSTYWYLGSPYSKYPGGIHAAFDAVCEIAARFAREGVAVYSPIAHTHPIASAGNIDPYDHSIWLPFDKPMMVHAHGLIVAQLEGWSSSIGLQAEIAFFTSVKRRILYLDPADTELATFFCEVGKGFPK